eukprot:CAMPEP_0113600204 /NCGR_PEP_ID=MMETSP0015_2-20120614/42581_1 /TAXON_ID=2838 /ORGANISM="Odontella" /LENGTH=136 /DNA_ID=CAMNT_0000508443 /DNA_START=317 /DNA_END=729 /DNA_ORIENTATION=+ /assembly_acc=CAM_ASM_000160
MVAALAVFEDDEDEDSGRSPLDPALLTSAGGGGGGWRGGSDGSIVQAVPGVAGDVQIIPLLPAERTVARRQFFAVADVAVQVAAAEVVDAKKVRSGATAAASPERRRVVPSIHGAVVVVVVVDVVPITLLLDRLKN